MATEFYTVEDLGNDLTGVLHGTTPNQIQNFNGLLNRAARQLLLDLDPQETKRTVEFVGPIFNSVYDYPLADDVKGNKIIDIFPQVQRLPSDIWLQSYNQAFDVSKQNIFSNVNDFTMKFGFTQHNSQGLGNSTVKTIRINAPFLNPPVIVNQIEAIATNGTWAVGGTASNLSVNNSNFVQGAGSLQFNHTTGSGGIQNSTMSAIDLSTVENQSYFFTWVYVPDGDSLDSVELRWGSSASDYWTVTTTQTQQGTGFVNGWNLCQFKWSDASVVGSPNSASITYGRVDLVTNADLTGCLVNGMNSVLGTVLSYSYYSNALFRVDNTGEYVQIYGGDTSDRINLDIESYNLLFYKVAEFAVQQQQGLDATFFDGPYFKNMYDAGILRYKSMYKSELQEPQSSYYNQPDTSYNRFYGRGWG